jgi:hypothetical protein
VVVIIKDNLLEENAQGLERIGQLLSNLEDVKKDFVICFSENQEQLETVK